MKITVLYATNRRQRSTTYQLAQTAIAKLSDGDEVFEFQLLDHVHHFCSGCFLCIEGKPERCRAYHDLAPIKKAMKESDLIIFAVPVYVYHVPGQVKTFLDHLAYEWMMHRPDELMFKKRALIICTAAGGGTKSTVQDVKHSLEYLGISRIYDFQKAVYAMNWSDIPESKQKAYQEEITALCDKIVREQHHNKPSLVVKKYFYLFRMLHKKGKFTESDTNYWREKGWLEKVRPWD